MMFRWLAVCLIAFAVAKWSGHVQADEELNEEEKRLLQVLESAVDERGNDKRSEDMCDLPECFASAECVALCCMYDCEDTDDADACFTECVGAVSGNKREMSCEETCSSASNPAECRADCEENNLLKRRMDLAARRQEAANNEISGFQKKIFGGIFRRIPPIPPIRIPPIRIPPIPRTRFFRRLFRK